MSENDHNDAPPSMGDQLAETLDEQRTEQAMEAAPDAPASALPAEVDHLPATPEGQTPGAFLQMALQQGLPIETLERLVSLYRQEQTEQARKAFHDALRRFQKLCPPILKDSEANFGSGGAAYRYASLACIRNTIQDALDQCGLSFRWEQDDTAEGITVRCIVTHVGGHSETTPMFAPADSSGKKNPIQARASTVTYLRRYTLSGALGLVIEDDDDAHGGYGQTRQSHKLPVLDPHVEWRATVTHIQDRSKWEYRGKWDENKKPIAAGPYLKALALTHPTNLATGEVFDPGHPVYWMTESKPDDEEHPWSTGTQVKFQMVGDYNPKTENTHPRTMRLQKSHTKGGTVGYVDIRKVRPVTKKEDENE